ncbi:MAG: nitrate- and nitrite sensing domain-containing protein [Thiotrichales bacterium]|nr:nitrate- and nitrite sensing domain-containing protein [Thiotrichales bacterium]
MPTPRFHAQIAQLVLLSKQAQTRSLSFLFSAAERVRLLQKIVHDLQLERGASVLYLTTHGLKPEAEKIATFRSDLALNLARLPPLISDWNLGAQSQSISAGVYLRLAGCLQILLSLPALRQQIDRQQIAPLQAIQAFSEVIDRVLLAVFEMAEHTLDRDVTRAMLALFNFMQAKEFAGQERALGAAIFASYGPNATLLEAWQLRIEQQANAFETFRLFASDTEKATLAQLKAKPYRQNLDAWRARIPSHHQADAPAAQDWFALMTLRIDGFQRLENTLVDQLQIISAKRLAESEQLMAKDVVEIEKMLQRQAPEITDSLTQAGSVSSVLHTQIQQQTRQLSEMEAQLVLAQQSLLDRKVIQKAKMLLQAQRGLSEEAAHAWLRNQAMNQGKKMIEVAKAVLQM